MRLNWHGVGVRSWGRSLVPFRGLHGYIYRVDRVLPQYKYSQQSLGNLLSQVGQQLAKKNGDTHSSGVFSTYFSGGQVSKLFDRTKILQRYSFLPIDGNLMRPETINKINVHHHFREYRAVMSAHLSQLIRLHFDNTRIPFSQVKHHVSFTSFFSAPAISDYATQHLPFSPYMTRLPLSNLGCVGGIRSLVTGLQLLNSSIGGRNDSHPGGDEVALVSVVESGMRYWRSFGPLTLMELWRQGCHLDLKDLKHLSLLLALFSDSAGCATLFGAGLRDKKLIDDSLAAVVDTLTLVSPQNIDLATIETGLYGPNAILKKQLVTANAQDAKTLINRLLQRNHLTTQDVRYWLVHPGGPALLEEIQRTLSLPPLEYSWKALREFGNTMCVSPFHLLSLVQTQKFSPSRLEPGYAILYAVGPGLHNAAALLRI